MLKINLKPSEWLRIGVLILVFVVGSTAAYQILQPKPRLPIYNPSDLNPAVVDDDLERVGPVSYTHLTLPTICSV